MFRQGAAAAGRRGHGVPGRTEPDGTKLASNASRRRTRRCRRSRSCSRRPLRPTLPKMPATATRRVSRRRGRWPCGLTGGSAFAARDPLAAEDPGRRDAQRAKQKAWDAAAAAGKRRGHRPGDEPPRANRDNTEPRANITDPDVRVMRNQKGYVAGYNGQLVVPRSRSSSARCCPSTRWTVTLLHPVLDTCRQQNHDLAARICGPDLRVCPAEHDFVRHAGLCISAGMGVTAHF